MASPRGIRWEQMFSHDLDRDRFPLPARSRGMVLGSIITVAAAAALVSAKTVPFLYAATAVGFVAAAALRGQLAQAVPRRGPVFWHLAAFLLYAVVSATWAMEPGTAILATTLATIVAAATLSLRQLFAEETRPNLLHMGEGFWVGYLVGLVYLAVEIATDQSIKIWVYNAVGIGPGDVNPAGYFKWSGGRLESVLLEDISRNMAPVSVLLWPAVMTMFGTLARSLASTMAVASVGLAGVVVMLSWHETSKVAFLAGLAAFVCAHLALGLTRRLLAVGWVIACLAVLPTVLLAHRMDLHNADWLQSSARHRIIIWNYTAERVLKAPWLGVGARTTYVLGPLIEPQVKTRPDEPYKRTLSIHSHSVYLQTWFELGLIGAVLLTLLGLSILQALASLTRQLQPYACATFATAAVMAASSYGMWQTWFVGTFGLCAALFGLGESLILKREGISKSGVATGRGV